MIEEQHIFNNRYRLDTKLGEGGMATVYCGTDTLLRRRVAVKVLKAHYAGDEEFVRRFYHEAESAARLSHPNIVNTYDVGREGETYYIVMELVDGPSLAEIISTDGRLPEPVAIDYAAQICNGLAYAHRQGLLHRDIKPANILITKDDVVKLSDFGIARAASEHTMAMTRPGLVMGSVYYLSPEQAQGHELQETSDLYSVGIVLYQMLTGKLPYTGESPVSVALKHVSDPVPVIDAAETGISPALSAIVNKLLQKNPENRFGSASEVASALREARERPTVPAYGLQDDSATHAIAAIPVPPPRPSLMPDRRAAIVERDEPRRRGISPMATLLVLALLIAAAAGYFATRPPAQVPSVKVDNYVGMSDAQASQAATNAGLVPKITRSASDSVAANHVMSQDPPVNSLARKGDAIAFVVSTGKPVVGLRDVTGYTLSDAQKDLQSDRLVVKVNRKNDPSPKDTVLDESPKPATNLRQGSVVTLLVSDGPAPVKMPNLVGKTLDQARLIAAKMGFTINIVERGDYSGYGPNQIAQQDPLPGQMVTSGSQVNVLVSKGGGVTNIPDVRGQDLWTAMQAFKSAGFDVNVTYVKTSVTDANTGKVITEQPQGPAEKGSQITVSVPVTGEVPDTGGMTLDDAKRMLVNYGYQLGNVTPTSEGQDGKVVRTEPEAGTPLNSGTPVNIYVNSAQASPQP